MLKALAVTGLTLAVWGLSAGCDDLLTSGAAAGMETVIPAAKVLQGGGGAMEQIQQRDRLQNGTGVNCLDGTSQATAVQQRAGQGQGDQLRLRDGSCQ